MYVHFFYPAISKCLKELQNLTEKSIPIVFKVSSGTFALYCYHFLQFTLHGSGARRFFGLVWFYGVQRHFQQYFSYIVVVSFIGGGNRSTRRKLVLSQVTDKPYHIMLHRVHLAWVGFKLTTLVVIGANCIGSLVGGRGRKNQRKNESSLLM
jgi:hypothetical protein